MGFKLTKYHRLLAAADFKRVFDLAEFRTSSRQLLLLARRNEQSSARIGLVISKKHIGSAVQRNRIKRLSRELFRHRCDALPLFDLLVIARAGLGELDNQKVLALFNQQLDGLIKQHNKLLAISDTLELS